MNPNSSQQSSAKPMKQPNIHSTYITGFGSGFFGLNEQEAPQNSLTDMNNAKIYIDKTIRPRMRLKRFFKGTDKIQGKPLFVEYNDILYLIFMANGQIHYIDYTNAPSVDNIIPDINNSFDPNASTVLSMVNYQIAITNGVDKLAFVDLNTTPFSVKKFVAIDNPTSAPTLAATGFSAGTSFPIYYAISFNSTVGETKGSPIANMGISVARDNWKSDGSQYITITRPSAPAGATSWNLYVATSSTGGSVSNGDMLQLASSLDVNQTTFQDNGSRAVNISSNTLPTDNSTDGPVCKYSSVINNGRIVLYGDQKTDYNIWLGGTGNYPLDLSSTHYGARIEVARGTGYLPKSILTFRAGTGQAVIRVDTQNSSGSSRFFHLTPNTITYGSESIIVWQMEEQNEGSIGATHPNSLITAKDNMYFYGEDGFYTTGTKALIQNLLSTDRISGQIQPYVDKIRSDAAEKIVGAFFNNIVYWGIPADGASEINTLLSYDLNGNGMWYKNQIKFDQIFIIDDDKKRPALAITHGADILLFEDAHMANDVLDENGGQPYVSSFVGAPIGMNPAKSMYAYMLQAVFNISDPKGTITFGISYKDKTGKTKQKQKTVVFSKFNMVLDGSYSDVAYVYNGQPMVAQPKLYGYSSVKPVDAKNGGADNSKTGLQRVKIPINAEYREVKHWLSGCDMLLDYAFNGVEYKTIGIGVGEDI